MPGLEQFQIPHDPDSEHQLHWQPGQHGKGILTPGGQLHHWPVDRIDGDPSHRRYIQEILGHDLYRVPDQQEKGHLFWLYPEGQIEPLVHGSTWGDPKYTSAMVKRIQAIDPRLGPLVD